MLQVVSYDTYAGAMLPASENQDSHRAYVATQSLQLTMETRRAGALWTCHLEKEASIHEHEDERCSTNGAAKASTRELEELSNHVKTR